MQSRQIDRLARAIKIMENAMMKAYKKQRHLNRRINFVRRFQKRGRTRQPNSNL
jgi:hypothetical protein